MPKPKYRRKKGPKSTRSRQQQSRKQQQSLEGARKQQEEESLYVEPQLPTWTKQEDVIDYLSEDDQVPNQRYACISTLSLSKWRTERQREEAIETICNKEGYDTELAINIIDSWSEYEESKRSLKIRGVYGSHKEAKKRAQYLQRTHKNHNVAVISSGYWVPFDPDPDKVADQNYMEREMNEMHEGYAMNREKGKEHFQEQAAMKAQRARIEGSKWGQEQLLKRKETKQEVEYRLKAAEEDIAQYTEKMERAKKTLEQANQKLEYMIEHPETVLEEEDTPIDYENVPDEVLQELKNKPQDDRGRLLLAEIEDARKRPNMGASAQAPLQSKSKEDSHPPQPPQLENPDIHQMFMEPSKLSEGFGDNVILPHQAREAIKKVSEEFKKNVPDLTKQLTKPDKPTKPKVI